MNEVFHFLDPREDLQSFFFFFFSFFLFFFLNYYDYFLSQEQKRKGTREESRKGVASSGYYVEKCNATMDLANRLISLGSTKEWAQFCAPRVPIFTDKSYPRRYYNEFP